MSGPIETPEEMAERLATGCEGHPSPRRVVAAAIRARDEQIAAALEAEASEADRLSCSEHVAFHATRASTLRAFAARLQAGR